MGGWCVVYEKYVCFEKCFLNIGVFYLKFPFAGFYFMRCRSQDVFHCYYCYSKNFLHFLQTYYHDDAICWIHVEHVAADVNLDDDALLTRRLVQELTMLLWHVASLMPKRCQIECCCYDCWRQELLQIFYDRQLILNYLLKKHCHWLNKKK